jgi:hypothetical protein
VDARYKPSYVITQDELIASATQVEKLHDIGGLIYAEAIHQFA